MNRVRHIIGCDKVYRDGIYGEGIGIAILDTGLSPHPDYRHRIQGWCDVVHGKEIPYDDSGHGTHVAGIAAGNGYLSHGLYQGIAPRAHLIGIKVLDHRGNGTIQNIMTGLSWILSHHERLGIRIVNISIGTNDEAGFDEDCALIRSVDLLWDAGIVVVAATGNKGPDPYTISAPGISRKIITVGSYDGARRYSPSGVGPTHSCIKKPDVVAPGHKIISCHPPIGGKKPYSIKSGTSMSTPIVSGGIALLLSRYPTMSPREVKIRLKYSSTDLHMPHERQGWGHLDVTNLLRVL